jgi:hypothetical protein
MDTQIRWARFATLLVVVALAAPAAAPAQDALKTPLEQEILTLLTNEISGQMAFNNLVKLAGAPWLREPEEFTDTFYEAAELYELVRGYGIDTVRLDRSPGEGTYSYPAAGELWIVEPEPRRVARLGADAALIASGSQSGEITGRLIYLPPMTAEQIHEMAAHEASAAELHEHEAGEELTEASTQGPLLAGKIALMWSHPRGDAAEALDGLGLEGVISFSSRERYLDPNQVVYSRGPYADLENLTIGMTVSWRQWSELLEDVERGEEISVRMSAQIEEYENKYETVFAWIPGSEPDAPGVIFTGHLFEGYTKRGANDDMGGPAVQLEILRALHHLIESGQIPRPRRSMYFLWPNEISGTYEFISRNPDLVDRLSININMDMVSEALRKNNSLFTMSETPPHLASYLDGLSKAVLNYVWRTNDIVYLPGAPRGRPGGQYFPIPMWEKNGSIDAFRFFIHEATGGSDHICFNNPSVAIPGIEFFTWPDQWYHADVDTPDKADPTEMKRVAFIGAAAALAAADLSDERIGRMLDAVSDFGYARFAERSLPQALALIDAAEAADLEPALANALNRVSAGIAREVDALGSIREIYTGSAEARAAVDDRIAQWRLYYDAVTEQVVGAARVRAGRLGVPEPQAPVPGPAESRFLQVPDLAPDVKRQQFNLTRTDAYRAYMEEHPDALEEMGLERNQTSQILNFINGERSVAEIRNRVAALTGDELQSQQVWDYLQLLEAVGWIVMPQ